MISSAMGRFGFHCRKWQMTGWQYLAGRYKDLRVGTSGPRPGHLIQAAPSWSMSRLRLSCSSWRRWLGGILVSQLLVDWNC